MKTILATVLAGGFSLALAAAAHAQSPQIPTPVNPYPINPVATDGTPLPSQSSAVRSGPSGGLGLGAPYGFVGEFVGSGVNAATGVVGAGLDGAGIR